MQESKIPLRNKEMNISIMYADCIDQILYLRDIKSPTYWQWTHFYFDIAKRHKALKGKYVDQDKIFRKIKKTRTYEWFIQHICNDEIYVRSFIQNMFRKHRKSFNYLSHILIWVCLFEHVDVNEIFKKLSKYPNERRSPVEASNSQHETSKELKFKRKRWEKLLAMYSKYGIKYIRENNQGLYIWLYRNDHAWFISTNKEFHLKRSNHSNVNWRERDKQYLIKLTKIYDEIDLNDTSQRHSKKWFINQMDKPSTFEKKLNKLPLCHLFLLKNSESVAAYQIRRALLQIHKNGTEELKYNESLFHRKCGLSHERMKIETQQFLQLMKSNFSSQNFEFGLLMSTNQSFYENKIEQHQELKKLFVDLPEKRVQCFLDFFFKIR